MKIFPRLGVVLLLAASGAYAQTTEKEPQCGEVVGNPALSIQVCTRLIEFGGLPASDLANAYYTRGTEWADQGNHDRAIADFNLALELDPKLAGAYFNRALSWSEKGDAERAVADYDAVLKLTPGHAKAHLGRAVEWTVRGDFSRAKADYDQVIRLEPQGATGYFGRARARFYSGDFMGAASDFIRTHQLDPSIYTAVWIFLARKHAGIPGELTLERDAGTSGNGEWPAPLVALYLSKSTPEAVQKAAAHQQPARQREQRCEANFYIAQWHLLQKARDRALPLLREAQTICPGTFVEHEGALVELSRAGAR